MGEACAPQSGVLRMKKGVVEMTLEDMLNTGRRSVSGCSVAAFGDTAARLILRASHKDGIRREYLDALCDHAANCFDLLDATWDIPGMAEDGADAVLNEATILSKTETVIFLRSEASPSEFLCFVCEDADAAPRVFAAARRTMTQIAAVQ